MINFLVSRCSKALWLLKSDLHRRQDILFDEKCFNKLSSIDCYLLCQRVIILFNSCFASCAFLIKLFLNLFLFSCLIFFKFLDLLRILFFRGNCNLHFVFLLYLLICFEFWFSMLLHEFFNFFILFILKFLQLFSLRFHYFFHSWINHHWFHFESQLRLEAKFSELLLRHSNFLFVIFDYRCISLGIISIIYEIKDFGLTLQFNSQVSVCVQFVNQAHQIANVVLISFKCIALVLKNSAHVSQNFACNSTTSCSSWSIGTFVIFIISYI